MEKILLVINGAQPSTAAIDFACHLAEVTSTSITGFFISLGLKEPLPILTTEENYFDTYQAVQGKEVQAEVEQATAIFSEACKQHHIPHQVLMNEGNPIEEVIFESRFADLVVLEPSLSFFEEEKGVPTHFVREVLSRCECPVLLAPGNYEEIDEVVFCYDGSASSVYAIKQFTYLFPEFNHHKALLLEVKNEEQKNFSRSHQRIMDWMNSHYRQVHYQPVTGDVKEALFSFFFMKRRKMIVMGAYGRGYLSSLFRKSQSDLVVRHIDLPMFISHY